MDIYVANINFKATSEDLKKLFGQYGDVKNVRLVTDRETGRSRGFAFVEMENDREAQDAIERLDGNSFMGRELVCNKAKPPKPKTFQSR